MKSSIFFDRFDRHTHTWSTWKWKCFQMRTLAIVQRASLHYQLSTALSQQQDLIKRKIKRDEWWLSQTHAWLFRWDFNRWPGRAWSAPKSSSESSSSPPCCQPCSRSGVGLSQSNARCSTEAPGICQKVIKNQICAPSLIALFTSSRLVSYFLLKP